MTRRLLAGILGLAVWGTHLAAAEAEDAVVTAFISDEAIVELEQPLLEVEPPLPPFDPFVEPAAFQPQPLLTPSLELDPRTPLPTTARERTLPASTALARQRARRAALAGGDQVTAGEAKARVTSDAGSLLRKSPSILGTDVQRRNPIITEPRVRGERVGRTLASGSYWVPARIDLDTMVSKLDSRIIADVVVIKGPYSALYGPGFEFLDIKLTPTPRYETSDARGATSFDYQTNGEQIYGRQSLWGGAENWGYRFGYGHRTGNNYESGNDTEIPASYNSRTFDFALGYDIDVDRHLEFNTLRLDQTNVELAGQAFDIDFLVTDGYEVEYIVDMPAFADRFTIDAWYNRTRLAGGAQNAAKRQTFPFYNFINFVGNTDVDSMSTGYSAAWTWGDEDVGQTIAGADLRYVKQELNEITSGRISFAIWNNRNSPIPESFQANPGIFIEHLERPADDLVLRAGGRLDFVASEVTAAASEIAALGTTVPPMTLAEILGSNEFDRNFSLGSAFLTATYDINPCWTLNGSAGYAARAPILTELYAAQPFMFLLQNGLNTVTGDPRLEPEQRYQLDLALHYDDGPWRAGITGYQAWIHDYITFENLRVFPPGGNVEQVSLKYVNTELAALTGGELFGEWDAQEMLALFGTLSYAYGRDRTRNGEFATRRGSPGTPSMRVVGLTRGFYSGVSGPDDEALPGISPLQSRVGIRLHQAAEQPLWLVELSARIVAAQDQVAASLLESPTPGFTVLDLRGYWQADEQLLLVAGVENLGDRNYREHLDFRSASGIQVFQPGINFYAGAELTY